MPFPSAMCIMKESYTSTEFWLAIRWMLSASVIRHPSVLLSRMTYRCYSLFLFNIRKEVSDDAQKWQERRQLEYILDARQVCQPAEDG